MTICWTGGKETVSSIANVLFHVHKIWRIFCQPVAKISRVSVSLFCKNYLYLLDNCSITILKSTNRGSEMTRVFRGLTNGYNIRNAFRQRSKKVFIDSGSKFVEYFDNRVCSKIRMN